MVSRAQAHAPAYWPGGEGESGIRDSIQAVGRDDHQYA